jgi:endonuclease/exonuclease/phosphatase family metal-dependent hydrolase
MEAMKLRLRQLLLKKFLFASYNVGKARREEAHEETKWMRREARVAALIRLINADIVCLQEMRALPNTTPTTQFLAELGYYYELGYRTASPIAFGQAILYNPAKFFVLETKRKWISATPDEPVEDPNTSSLLLGVRFHPVEGGALDKTQTPFWVWNAHFQLDEQWKTDACTLLKGIIHSEEPYFVAGDLNLFPDRRAAEQRAILAFLQDLGAGARTSQAGRLCEGTFVGYEHDEFKADLANMVSRLDHILGSEHWTAAAPTLWTQTMMSPEPAELSVRNAMPSDHLPLTAWLEIA